MSKKRKREEKAAIEEAARSFPGGTAALEASEGAPGASGAASEAVCKWCAAGNERIVSSLSPDGQTFVHPFTPLGRKVCSVRGPIAQNPAPEAATECAICSGCDAPIWYQGGKWSHLVPGPLLCSRNPTPREGTVKPLPNPAPEAGPLEEWETSGMDDAALLVAFRGWIKHARESGALHVSLPLGAADQVFCHFEAWERPEATATTRFLEASSAFFDCELAQTSDVELEGTNSASAPAEFMNFMDAGREYRKQFPAPISLPPPTVDPLQKLPNEEGEAKMFGPNHHSAMLEMIGFAATGKCMACGWPLNPEGKFPAKGCLQGNCSFRPVEHTTEYSRWWQRTQILSLARKYVAGEVSRCSDPNASTKDAGLPSAADLDRDAEEKKAADATKGQQ